MLRIPYAHSVLADIIFASHLIGEGVTPRVTCPAVVQVGPYVSLTSVAGVAVAIREARGARRAGRSASGSVAGARGARGVAGAAIGRIAGCVSLAPVRPIAIAILPPVVTSKPVAIVRKGAIPSIRAYTGDTRA